MAILKKFIRLIDKKLKKWSQVKPGDTAVYRKFFNFLIKCESLADQTNWSVFNSPGLLCMFISKLPTSNGDNWNRKIQSIRKQHKREPDLADLIRFVDKETQLVNNQLYSQEARQKYAEEKEKDKKCSYRSEKRIRTLATQINEQVETKVDEKDNKGAVSGPCCSKSRDLEQ